MTDYTYDYTKCMMMKLFMAEPDNSGGSNLFCGVDDAIKLIREADNITQGITKIIYLVGWQYLGHDDKYPDFFEVNPIIKRKEDASAYDSLIWLMREAKKHNTVVSLHINFCDAYDNAPSFNEYLKHNALIRNKKGVPHAIEKYNGKKCYKVSLKEEWESGLFVKRFDRLLALLPLEEAGTLHVDNFQCYTNYKPYVSIGEMQEYRIKMLDYAREKGIDITSEFTYREDESLKNKPIFGLPREHRSSAPLATIGKIPASWWYNYLTKKELIEIPPQVYCGGMMRNKGQEKYLYGNIQGEDLFKAARGTDAWHTEFIKKFATEQVPYHFLCTHTRLALGGRGIKEFCGHTGGVVSYKKNRRIEVNGEVIKDNEELLLPFVHRKDTYIAYSKSGVSREWSLLKNCYNLASVYAITPEGNKFLREEKVSGSKFRVDIQPLQALLIKFKRTED